MSKYDLLSVDRDAKTKKGKAYGWLTAILFLSPAKEADGIHEMCGGRSDECTLACLNHSGMSEVYPSIIEARVQKTLDYIADFSGFCDRLERDTEKLLIEAESRSLKPAERLNGTSVISPSLPEKWRGASPRCSSTTTQSYPGPGSGSPKTTT